MIVAIALDRYRLANGSYPKDLAAVVPNVLKSIPADFMDGKPLRYRLVESNAFVLYSVGLDCADDRGEFAVTNKARSVFPNPDPADGPDLIWPRPASEEEAQAFGVAQTKAREELQKRLERQSEEHEKEREQHRQRIIEELAVIYRKRPKCEDRRSAN